MPFANNGGVRIHYEVEGQGPPLVLLHGFTGTLKTLYQLGYVNGLKDEYRLVLFDARGHGSSDKPHDPLAYGKRLMASDVAAVLDDLGLTNAHYLGYSMGGFIGFAVARFFPDRLASLVIGGAHPYERDPNDPDPVEIAWAEQQIAAWKQGLQAVQAQLPPSYQQWLYLWDPAHTDPDAYIAWLRQKESECVGLIEGVRRLGVPILLYAGEGCGHYANAKRCASEVPGVRFVTLPGLNHWTAFVKSDLVLPHVRRFLAEVEGRGPQERV